MFALKSEQIEVQFWWTVFEFLKKVFKFKLKTE